MHEVVHWYCCLNHTGANTAANRNNAGFKPNMCTEVHQSTKPSIKLIDQVRFIPIKPNNQN